MTGAKHTWDTIMGELWGVYCILKTDHCNGTAHKYHLKNGVTTADSLQAENGTKS